MSTRLKKNVLKPEHANEKFSTQWDEGPEKVFAIDYGHIIVNEEDYQDDYYQIDGTHNNVNGSVKLYQSRGTEEEFIQAYKKMVKDLRKIGKIMSIN